MPFYASGILLSLYYLLRDKPFPAVLWFSFAFCIKLQAIFFLPVLIGYCLKEERTAGYLVAIPLLYFVSIIPARLGGGALTDLLLVYGKRSRKSTARLAYQRQNVFALFSNYSFTASELQLLMYAGVAAGLLVSLGIATMVYKNKLSSRAMVLVSLLCFLLVPYVLPRLLERYFYLADIISVLYACYAPRSWYLPVLVVGASFLAYMPYLSQLSWLSGVHVNLVLPSLMVLAAVFLIFVQVYRVVLTADRVVS